MTLDDSSNKLSSGSFLVEETSSEVKECLVWAVRYELFSFMNVHVISSARWRHNPPAVTGEFSLALRLQEERHTQRHHTALVGCCHLFALPLYPPNDDREQLLRCSFEFLWDVYFLWRRHREHKRGLFGRGGAVCPAIPGVMFEKSVSHF